MKQQQVYLNLAESLATLFAPMVEVVLYSARDEVLGVFNRLTNDNIAKSELTQPLRVIINKKQHAKAMIIPLEKGYYLRLIVEISLFESLQNFLQHYLLEQTRTNEAHNWQQL